MQRKLIHGGDAHTFTREDKVKGGSVRGITKSHGLIKSKSKIARCKNCPLECDYKEERVERNPNSVCVCPSIRAESIISGMPVEDWNLSFTRGGMKGLHKELIRYKKQIKKRLNIAPIGKIKDALEGKLLCINSMLWNRYKDMDDKLAPKQIDVRSVNLNFNQSASGESMIAIYERLQERRKKDEKRRNKTNIRKIC